MWPQTDLCISEWHLFNNRIRMSQIILDFLAWEPEQKKKKTLDTFCGITILHQTAQKHNKNTGSSAHWPYLLTYYTCTPSHASRQTHHNAEGMGVGKTWWRGPLWPYHRSSPSPPCGLGVGSWGYLLHRFQRPYVLCFSVNDQVHSCFFWPSIFDSSSLVHELASTRKNCICFIFVGSEQTHQQG